MAGGILERMAAREHEEVAFYSDPEVGLQAIIAIHDTTLGPALGGCRMWIYPGEEEALEDVLRLSRAMTYKAAAAGLNLGGGKAVILARPDTRKDEGLMRAFGRFVHSLSGRYVTAEDVGTSVQDMEWIRTETPYVTGIDLSVGGSGDPSPMTAWGVFQGVKASVRWLDGSEDLSGKTVAVQGAGHTGYWLSKYLHDAGARLFITDIAPEKVKRVVEEFGAEAVAPDAIFDTEADIFAPCALGAVVNDETIGRLRTRIIAGSANNVLQDEKRHAALLQEKGILYAPDFVINAGGVINIAVEIDGYDEGRARRQTDRIYDTLTRVYELAKKKGIPTIEAANEVARRRIEMAAHLKRRWGAPREALSRRARITGGVY